jgi:hypothetical protein
MEALESRMEREGEAAGLGGSLSLFGRFFS